MFFTSGSDTDGQSMDTIAGELDSSSLLRSSSKVTEPTKRYIVTTVGK